MRMFRTLKTVSTGIPNHRLYDTWAIFGLEYSVLGSIVVLWFFLMVLFRRW